MATYLITGGAGFIGSHLADALQADGHAVRVLDDLSTGTRANLKPGVELHVGKAEDKALVEAVAEGADGIFHLAAVASVQASIDDWLGTHAANLTATVTVLDAARRANAAGPVPVVYASSAAIYGDNPAVPLKETETPRPLSAYAADKYGSELHARVASHLFSIPTTGFRFFNIYGPRQNPSSPYSGVISIFADRFSRGEGVTVFGDGEQSRDFVFVADVVRGLRAAMDEPGDGARVFNIARGVQTSINDLARTLAGLFNADADIAYRDARAGDIRHSAGDPAALKSGLGVVAETGLEEGLAKLVEHLKGAG
ncbi:MAG: NAD-dependent epimerase/dehydratase family protein [Pseudomonadota bacterium]